jgi:uncharacterized protein
MQKIFAFTFFLIPFLVFGFVVPEKPTSFVSDFANILQTDQKVNLENKLLEIERQTTNEIAVVIIDSLDGDSIENVSQAIFDRWKIGKKGKDNGVLILLSINDRTMRIQTGYGVEGVLTDLQTKYIQDEVMAPAFREGKYFEGLVNATDKISQSLSGLNIVPEGYNSNSSKGFKFDFAWLIFIFFGLLQWIISVLAKSKSFWGGGVLAGVIILIVMLVIGTFSIFFFVVVVLLGLLIDFLVSRAYQNHKDSGGKNPPWFMGGGFGGGGGSSGFGGFGGGFSGGGGSSSRW